MPSQGSSSVASEAGRGSLRPGIGRLLRPAGWWLAVCLALAVPAWAGAAPADTPGGGGLEGEVERVARVQVDDQTFTPLLANEIRAHNPLEGRVDV